MNRKGLVGFAKYSLLVLCLAAIVSFAALNLGAVSANTHTSTITVTPDVVQGGINDQFFTAHVECTSTGGSPNDEIHEVRIYEHFDFTDIKCNPVDGWYGPFPGENQYGKFCLWTARAGYELGVGESQNFTFTADTPATECCRQWLMETRDKNNYWIFNYPYICIDTTPPETTKTYGDPHFPININDPLSPYPHWITTQTLITLEATDCPGGCDIETGPHDSGIDKTWYYDEVVDEIYCKDKNACENWDVCPTPYDPCDCNKDKIMENENGMECVNNAQKICEDIPAVCTEYGTHLGYKTVEDCIADLKTWEVCVEKVVNDPVPPGGIGCVSCDCKNNWQLYRGVPFQKPEESCHIIQFFSVDGLGNKENVHRQCVFVENKPPVGIKEIGDPKIPITDNVEEVGKGTVEWSTEEAHSGAYAAKLYVSDGTQDWAGIDIPVDIPLDQINSLAFWEFIKQYTPGKGYSVNVILGVDSDGDGTFESDIAAWHVPQPGHNPATLGGDTFIEMDGVSGNPATGVWSQTNAYNTAQWWTVNLAGDGFAGGNVDPNCYNTLSTVINSCAPSDVRFEPTDHVKLIKLEIGGSGSWNDETAFVDGLSLNDKVILDEPKNWWVSDHVTPITLDCKDQYPHPVDHEQVCYKVSFDGTPADLTEQYCKEFEQDGVMNKDGWCCADVSDPVINGDLQLLEKPIIENKYTFTFMEDSVHDLEYYCIDALENKNEIDKEWFKVDSQPPVITKTMIGTDHLGDCPPGPSPQEPCYVRDDGQNGVSISVADDTKYGCVVDDVECTYELWWVTDLQTCINEFGGTHLYNEQTGQCFVEGGSFGENGQDILFKEDSTHILKIECKDALDNKVEDTETFLVDSTPPETTKTYGDPQKVDPKCLSFCEDECMPELTIQQTEPPEPGPECVNECTHKFCTMWITSDTEVTLEAVDEKVGQVYPNTIYWRNLWFPANDEICHLSTMPPVVGVAQVDGIPQNNCNPDYYIGKYGIENYNNLQWNEYTKPFTKPEESCHVIEYKAVDKLGNEELIKWQCVFVDNTAPQGIKEVGDPKLPCVAPDGPVTLKALTELPERTGDTYVAPTLAKGAEVLNLVDPCASISQGAGQCAYVDAASAANFVKDTMIAQGANPANCGNILVLSSGNPLDNDNTISTGMGNPGCGNNPDGFATYDCVILLGYTPEENSVALAISSEWPEYYQTTFTDWMQIGGIVDMSINSWPGQPSLKLMPAYDPSQSGSVALATLAASKSVDLRVADSGDGVYDTAIIVVPLSCFETPPTPELCGNDKLEPGEECDDGNTQNGDGCSSVCLIEKGPTCWWVRDHVTPITLDCKDQGPHPVEQETVCYRVSFDEETDGYITDKYCEEFGGKMTGEAPEDWCCAYVGDDMPIDAQPAGAIIMPPEKNYTLYFMEDSVHDLEYYCTDHLGNENNVDLEYFRVDSIPPTTTKQYLGPFYVDQNKWEYIDTASTVELTATDGGTICAVDDVSTYYRYSLVPDSMCEDNCVCANSPEYETFDLTGDVAGTVTKIDNGDSFTWAITITSDNPAGHKWGVGMAFATSLAEPAFQVWFREYEEPFGWYYQDYGTGWNGAVVDLPTQGITAAGNQNGQVFTITVPKSKLGGGCATFYWGVQARTNLLGKYPSTWKQWSGGSEEVSGMQPSVTGGTDNWNLYESPFGIPEESCHIIQFYSEDALGNKEDVKAQCVFVDKTAPVIEKAYGQPYFTENGIEWISSKTPINIKVYDPEPHPSGVNDVQYRVTLLGSNESCLSKEACEETDGSGNWIQGSEGFSFTIAEDSCHLIEITAKDNVDKSSTHKQCVFVDNKAPYPNKTVGDPKTMWNGSDAIFYPWIKDRCWNGQEDEIECWKVTMGTPINLECIDQEPHPVDHNRVCFKVELDGEDATDKYCNELDAQFVKSENTEEDGFCCLKEEKKNFVFKEETEHNLKYYCEDALGNRGPIDEEKFKVEGTKFKIPLLKKWNLISVPFVLINDNPAEVFKDTPGVLSVWSWDSENGWRYFTPEEDDPDTLTEILPGWGYWVLENNTEECLMLGGSLFSPKTLPPSKELTKGWNLIGFYGTNWQLYGQDKGTCGGEIFGEKVYCALNSLIDTQEGYPRWSSLWTYINQGDHNTWWEGLSTCAAGYDKMYAGKGYWIEIDVNDLYAPASTCIWNDDFKCIGMPL